MKINVGVIFGGCTVEHEVGIISAVHAMEFFDTEKYNIIPIYITKENKWYSSEKFKNIETFKNYKDISKIADEVYIEKKSEEFILLSKKIISRKISNIDVVLPIVHGKGIEDGVLAGTLNMIGIPYAGPDVLGAAIGQDKVVQKLILKNNGINVPDFEWFYDVDYINEENEIINRIEKIGYPVIVKPANLGSSIGIKIAKNKEALIDAITDAIKYDKKIVVERVIKNNKEVHCAVLGNNEYQEVSQIGEVIKSEEYFSFDEKYISGAKKGGKTQSGNKMSSGFKFPANLDKKLVKEIQEMSKKAFKILDLKGVTRFDYLIDSDTNKIYFNEPNTIPGSLAFYFFNHSGKTYSDLLSRLIEIALEEHKREIKKISQFDSNILSTYNGVKNPK